MYNAIFGIYIQGIHLGMYEVGKWNKFVYSVPELFLLYWAPFESIHSMISIWSETKDGTLHFNTAALPLITYSSDTCDSKNWLTTESKKWSELKLCK